MDGRKGGERGQDGGTRQELAAALKEMAAGEAAIRCVYAKH